MRIVFTSIVFLAILNLFSSSAYGQDLTGIWRGYFYTDAGEQYKYEVQIDHKKNNAITGVTYSYLDTRFYGKAVFAGNYARATGDAVVQENKTVELRMSGGSVACIMKCYLTYTKSGKEEFLEGTFSSVYEKTSPTYGITKGGNCGGGKVYLRKVPVSDFYPEPFLEKKAKATPKNPTGEKKPAVVQNKTRNPKSTATSKSKPVAKSSTPVGKAPVVKKPKLDSIKTTQPEKVVIETRPIDKKITSVPLITRDRKNELTKTLIVNNEDIEVRLYDNGEIDNDTISVYLDGKLIISNKRLSATPIVYKMKLDEGNEEHTLVMVAENLGRIPPNTSLMVVQDGDHRYQVGITSTEQKNAMVKFVYRKKEHELD